MATQQEFAIAIKGALDDGDTAAAAVLRKQMQEAGRDEMRQTYKPDTPTGVDAVRANIGAGMHRAYQGVTQLLPGGATAQEVKNEDKIRAQLARSTPLGGTLQFLGEAAPLLVAPGAGAARGAAALGGGKALQLAAGGAGAGAVGGALGATDNTEEGIAQGKFNQAATGLVAGGILGPVVGSALPNAARAAKQYVMPVSAARQNFVRAAAGDAAGEIDPALAQAASRRITQNLRETALPGAPDLPTAALVGHESPNLMALHRSVAQTGGESVQKVRDLPGHINTAQANALRELEDVPRQATLTGENQALYALFNDRTQTRMVTPLVDPSVKMVLNHEIKYSSGKLQDELRGILQEYQQFEQLARNTNNYGPLLDFRKQVLDDRVSRLYKAADSNVGDALARTINERVRPWLDHVTHNVSGGATTQITGPGNRASQILGELGQLKQAGELVTKMEKQSMPPIMGEQPATSPRMITGMRELVPDYAHGNVRAKTNEYGQQLVNPQQAETIATIQRQAEALRALEAPGQQSGANMRRTSQIPNVLERADKQPLQAGVSTAAVLTFAGHPGAAMASFIANSGVNMQAKRAAAEYVKLLTDPAHAQRILDKAARGDPAAQLAIAAIKHGGHAALGAGATELMQNPRRRDQPN